MNERNKQLKLISVFLLSTNCNYRKSFMLDIEFFQLINIFLLHYTVAGAVVIHMLKQNSDTKYLLIALWCLSYT